MIDPTIPMAHHQANEFLPSAGVARGSRKNMAEPEADDFDVTQFNTIRKEQKEQMMELDKHYQDRKDVIQKQIQAEQEGLFNAFQQGMQTLYGSLVQQVAATIEVQVTLRMDQEKLQEEHAARKRDIERRYHQEASRLVLSTSHHATRNSKQLLTTTTNGSHANSFSGTNGDNHQPTPTASAIQTPPVQYQTATRPASTERLPRDFVLQEPPRREYLAPYPTPQEFVPSQSISAPSGHRPIQPQPAHVPPLPVRQNHEEAVHSQPQQASHHPHQHQYHEPSNVTPRSDLKRKAYESASTPAVLNNPGKRPRTSEKPIETFQDTYQAQIKPSPRTPRPSQPTQDPHIDRTIPFEEIYQDGKAQYKHKIFEHKAGSGNWYIVRCDEHQVHFGYGNPLHGAAKHVHSPQHGNLEKKHDLALQICGHRITGCNAELATLNNRVFEHAVKEQGYVPFNMNLLTKEGRRRLHDGAEIAIKTEGHVKKKPAKLNINCDEANNVQDCNFYQGLWSPTKKWYALIVLPILPDGSLKDAGLAQITLGETDLMDKVPLCYRVDRNSLRIKEWRAAYKPGGDKLDKREYPVMFFDGVVRNSLGWLPASKLKPLDLDNPPDDVDRRGLTAARTWFAQKMMHRKDWEDYKRFGPGRPPTSEGASNKPDQVPSLRSARADAQSPIRDKSNKPEGFSVSSSEEGSDEEDPRRTDIGPILEPTDSNYVEDSSSELSDVEMGDAQKVEELGGETLAKRAPGPETNAEETNSAGQPADSGKGEVQTAQLQTSPEAHSVAKVIEVGTEAKRPPVSSTGSDYELRKDAQARAAAAAMEAVSRSRASSEVPEGASSYQAHLHSPNGTGGTISGRPLRPNGLEHQRSVSDDNLTINSGTGRTIDGRQVSEVRKPSDLHSILNQEHISTVPSANASSTDPYKRAEAIAAQMEGLKSRSASAPIHEGKSTPSPFPPPPLPPAPAREALSQGQQQYPPLSQILSPPIQSPVMMPPKSSSSTPVQAEVGRSSPKSQQEKWQAVRTSYLTSQTPTRASFVNMTSTIPSMESTPKTVTQPLMCRSLTTPSTQLGTPTSDKQENFDVSQFRDSARGVRWSRDGPDVGFLRLTTDAMRGWAETVRGSPLTATIEPTRIVSIEVDVLDGNTDKERVNLIHKDGNQQTLVFETNSECQRLVKAAVQRRRFVTWFKKNNSSVEYKYGSENRRASTVTDDRWSVATE